MCTCQLIRIATKLGHNLSNNSVYWVFLVERFQVFFAVCPAQTIRFTDEVVFLVR